MTLQPGQIILEAALASDPSATSPTWTDLSSLHRASSIDIAGRSDPLDQPSAATLESRLANLTRALDPAIDPRVRPRKRVRIRSVGNGYAAGSTPLTVSGNEITDSSRALRVSGDGRPFVSSFDFSGGFEPGDDSEWTSIQVASYANQFAVVSTDPLPRYGTKSAKFTVRPGDVVASGERSEVLYSSDDSSDGEEFFYSWSTLFPVGWKGPTDPENPPAGPTGGGFKIFSQFHDDTSGGPPTIQFRAGANNLRVRLNTGVLGATNFGTYTNEFTIASEIRPGEWNDFVVWVKWRVGSTGALKVWHRAGTDAYSLVVDVSGIPTLQSAGAGAASAQNYFKQGLYRDAESYTESLYHDGFRRSRSFVDAIYGQLSPESSFGIWRAATNLAINGSAATDLTGINVAGSVTLTREVTSDTPFGGTRVKVVTGGVGTGEGVAFRSATGGAGLASGSTVDGSVFVKAKAGQRMLARVITRVHYTDASQDDSVSPVFDMPQEWTRIWSEPITANIAKTIDTVRVYVVSTVTAGVFEFYAVGAQVELGTTVTPYISTAGAVATRNAARVQLPVGSLDETQGWIAFLVRPGWDFDEAPATNPYVFRWRDDDSNEIRLRYLTASDSWELTRRSAGAGSTRTFGNQTFARGSRLLVVAYWTATEIGLTIASPETNPDGAFNTAANTNIPTLAATTLDVGSSIGANNHFDGDFLWVARGAGTITAADVAKWVKWIGTDPLPSDAYFGDPADAKAVWRGFNENYLQIADATFFDGFAEAWNPSFPAGGFDSEVNLRASDATNILATMKLPEPNPAEEDFFDFLDTFRPSLLYPFNEKEGTKVVHHTKKKRNRRKGESRKHYRHHGFKHWKTRETRSHAEGQSGPTGSYKNTPDLGEPPLVRGSLDTCVRLKKASSEYIRILMDSSDTDLVDSNRLTSLILFEMASNPASNAAYNLISLPVGAPVGQENPVVRLKIQRSLVGAGQQNYVQGFLQLGTQQSDPGTSSPSIFLSTGTPGLAAITWDGTTSKVYVAGAGTGDVVQLAGSETEAGSPNLTKPNPGDDIFVGRDQSNTTPAYFDGWLAAFTYIERAISITALQRIYDAAFLRGFDQDFTSERLRAILDAVGWPATMREFGTDVGRTILPRRQFGQSPLEEIQRTSESEQPGFIYVRRNGSVSLRDKSYQTTGTPWATFGDDPSVGEVPYRDIEVEFTEDTIRNVISIDREESDTETVVFDQPSIDAYWNSPEDLGTMLLTTDAELDEIAAGRLAALKDPSERPVRMELDSDMDDRIFALLGSLEVGDLVRVWRSLPNSGRKSWDVRISGGSISIDGLKMVGSLDLAPIDL